MAKTQCHSKAYNPPGDCALSRTRLHICVRARVHACAITPANFPRTVLLGILCLHRNVPFLTGRQAYLDRSALSNFPTVDDVLKTGHSDTRLYSAAASANHEHSGQAVGCHIG